jgi:hypothetical protein
MLSSATGSPGPSTGHRQRVIVCRKARSTPAVAYAPGDGEDDAVLDGVDVAPLAGVRKDGVSRVVDVGPRHALRVASDLGDTSTMTESKADSRCTATLRVGREVARLHRCRRR